MNSSKIVLNTSASFSSLRIENPKKGKLIEGQLRRSIQIYALI